MTSERRPGEVPGAGGTLRGWWYPAGSGSPGPGIVMIHGFSATATGMVADRYAERFAEAGVAALLLDPRGFGRSDGEPRHQINPWEQGRDYLAGIDFLAHHPDVDAARIGVWGDSLSGRVALVVAAVDDRVAAVVVQVPACGPSMTAPDPDGLRYSAIRQTLLNADLSEMERSVEGPLPVVSPDQLSMPSLLEPITAYRWFLTYGARYGTGWQNRATVAVLDTPEPFDAQPCMAHVSAPLLMVVAEHDEMPGANADVARAAFELAPEPKELFGIGGGHFGLLYEDEPAFETSVRAQVDFLTRYLVIDN
jgi:pimeloyl-ACP methyl ester carboxylesterase